MKLPKDLSAKKVELEVNKSGVVYIMNVLHDDGDKLYGLDTTNCNMLQFDKDRVTVIEVNEITHVY